MLLIKETNGADLKEIVFQIKVGWSSILHLSDIHVHFFWTWCHLIQVVDTATVGDSADNSPVCHMLRCVSHVTMYVTCYKRNKTELYVGLCLSRSFSRVIIPIFLFVIILIIFLVNIIACD